ncbi:hypothetical protein ACKWTF_014598 [Chironomus riparius]
MLESFPESKNMSKKMRRPVVNNCFFCFDLKVGCCVYSVVQIVLYSLGLIVAFIKLGSQQSSQPKTSNLSLPKEVPENIIQGALNATLQGTFSGKILVSFEGTFSNSTQESVDQNKSNGFFLLIVIVCLTIIVVNSLFVNGTYSNSAASLVPYIFVKTIFIFYVLIYLLTLSNGFWIGFIIFLVAVDVYLLVCAYSLYLCIQNKDSVQQTEEWT